MPIGFLTRTERERLNRFPAQIPDEDLRGFFLLSDADQTAIHKQREAHTRLGFAMQLCALRYLGFAPDNLSTAPWDAVVCVASRHTREPCVFTGEITTISLPRNSRETPPARTPSLRRDNAGARIRSRTTCRRHTTADPYRQ